MAGLGRVNTMATFEGQTDIVRFVGAVWFHGNTASGRGRAGRAVMDIELDSRFVVSAF